jgi:hypothetical protein
MSWVGLIQRRLASEIGCVSITFPGCKQIDFRNHAIWQLSCS